MTRSLEQTAVERFRGGLRPGAAPFPQLRGAEAPGWDMALAALVLIAAAAAA